MIPPYVMCVYILMRRQTVRKWGLQQEIQWGGYGIGAWPDVEVIKSNAGQEEKRLGWHSLSKYGLQGRTSPQFPPGLGRWGERRPRRRSLQFVAASVDPLYVRGQLAAEPSLLINLAQR